MFYKNYTFEQEDVSDLHKEAYNLRPSIQWWETWNKSNNDKKQKIWNEMIERSLRNV